VDPGYFGPDGVAANDNVLFGDFFYLDPELNLSDGNALIAIEADPLHFQPGTRTFYGRYVGATAADAREPLPTRWAALYLNGGTFSGGTDLLYWREAGGVGQPFPCGHPPGWYPGTQRDIETFDEQEHPVTPFVFPVLPPLQPPMFPFAAAAGRTLVGAGICRSPIASAGSFST
jgi:hypothetical protein